MTDQVARPGGSDSSDVLGPLLDAWAKAEGLRFVNRSYGQYTTNTVSRESLSALVQAAVAAQRERFRVALLDEAAQWTGDYRTPVHKGFCDAAKRAGVPLTLDECYQATQRA